MSHLTTSEKPEVLEPPSLSDRQINVIFGTIVLGLMVAALDQTIVSTALPTITADLGDAQHLSWVVTSYILASTIACVIAGRLGDLFGRKIVFQVCVGIFLVGSFFCGLAGDMTFLIAMRAVQGIGAGGITITASALIASVIPLRKRAKYQGALGAVYGVTTVIGPLLGGLFTDHLSWRWAFYVNVPVAVVVIAIASCTIPGLKGRDKPIIDYGGVITIALGASGLTLATSWGGTQYAWGSATIIGLFAGSVVALGLFVVIERRTPEPILPLRLFANPVFTVASVLGFIVGFAMVGSLTFLPSYLQYVGGASATMSGIRMLPMVMGILVMSLLSGIVVGATGRYKPFPIVGTLLMTVSIFLLSTMDESTPILTQSLFMFGLGAGLGLSMQVLVIIVQNTSGYRDLGAATSGVTFFRTLGSSFGAAIMGTVYANHLQDTLPGALARAGVSPEIASSPTALHDLPDAERAIVVRAYAEALHAPFLYVLPAVVLAFLLALFLPQVKLKGTAQAAMKGTGEGYGMPDGQDSDEHLEAVIGRILNAHPDATATVLARSGSDLDRAAVWGLRGVHMRERLLRLETSQEDIEKSIGVPHGVLTAYYDDLVASGHLVRTGETLRLTPRSRAELERLVQAWREWLLEQLKDWMPDADESELDARARAVVDRGARRAMLENQGQKQQRVAEAVGAGPGT